MTHQIFSAPILYALKTVFIKYIPKFQDIYSISGEDERGTMKKPAANVHLKKSKRKTSYKKK